MFSSLLRIPSSFNLFFLSLEVLLHPREMACGSLLFWVPPGSSWRGVHCTACEHFRFCKLFLNNKLFTRQTNTLFCQYWPSLAVILKTPSHLGVKSKEKGERRGKILHTHRQTHIIERMTLKIWVVILGFGYSGWL